MVISEILESLLAIIIATPIIIGFVWFMENRKWKKYFEERRKRHIEEDKLRAGL